VRSSLDKKTAVELLWNNIDGNSITPGEDPSPLAGVPGPGDGTVPAWSAWHAYCRPQNCHDLKQAKEHGALLEHPEVLTLIESVVDSGKPKAMKARARRPAVARQSKVATAVDEWAKKAKRKQPPPSELFQQPVKRAIVSRLIAGDKPRMTSRRPRALTGKGSLGAKPKKSSRSR
jgi:hypothetical protein